MSYLSDWNDAELHWQKVQARFPGCLGGTLYSLGCTAPEHSLGCNQRRFDMGYGVWCREPTNHGLCARIQNHDGDHIGLETYLAERQRGGG